MRKELKIISLSEIKTEEVKWLWYPYIPFGKVTIVQGDPGEGKTTFVLSVIAALTRGEALPECETGLPQMNVIYQTAEDGLADTIKPRLEAVGADCSRVQTIDDSKSMLTLTDQRLEEAIYSTDAGLLVLDPLQAYLGSGVDMHRANEIRPIMKKLSAVAERTGCAVVLIGHMNKASGMKSGYRGLGSIDFTAAARSMVLEAAQGRKSVTFLGVCTLAFFPHLAAHEALCALLRRQVGRYPRQKNARCLGTFRGIFVGVRPFENGTMIKGGTPKGAPPAHKAPQRGSYSDRT